MHSATRIRPFAAHDPEALAQAFAPLGWPGKTVSVFEDYLTAQRSGSQVWLIAETAQEIRGYCGLEWRSRYAPFRAAEIPEIVDLNVLPAHRRRGVATQLLDGVETHAATRSLVVGLGVGLYADYAGAWRLYLRRGFLPDGRGIAYDGQTVLPGQSVTLDDDAVIMMTRPLPAFR